MRYPYSENYGAIKPPEKRREDYCYEHLRIKSRDVHGKRYCDTCEELNPSRDEKIHEVVADLSRL